MPCIYEPPECEDLPDNLMGKHKLFPSRQKGGGFIVSSYAHRKPKVKYIMGRTGMRDEFGKDRFPI